jgi:S1-C subfamily serine protease
VTTGIVSAEGRDIGYGRYNDFIQIDAPTNQGSSGGPTFDLAGNVIGVNTALWRTPGADTDAAPRDDTHHATRAFTLARAVSMLRAFLPTSRTAYIRSRCPTGSGTRNWATPSTQRAASKL